MIPEDIAKKLVTEVGEAIVGKTAENAPGKIEKVLNIMFPFVGLKKVAVETYVNDIKKSSLSPDEKMLAIYNTKKTFKELKNQTAIVGHAYNAAKPGTDFSESSAVDDDWLARFLDAGGFVSDEEVQVLWGNVLAGEFERPGSAPLSLIRILSEINRKHAQSFMTISSMRVNVVTSKSDGTPLTASKRTLVPPFEYLPSFSDIDLSYHALSELESLGLIHLQTPIGLVDNLDPNFDDLYLVCNGTTLKVSGLKSKESIPIGMVVLTEAGLFLQQFAPESPPDGYREAIIKYLSASENITVEVSQSIKYEELISDGDLCIHIMDSTPQ